MQNADEWNLRLQQYTQFLNEPTLCAFYFTVVCIVLRARVKSGKDLFCWLHKRKLYTVKLSTTWNWHMILVVVLSRIRFWIFRMLQQIFVSYKLPKIHWILCCVPVFWIPLDSFALPPLHYCICELHKLSTAQVVCIMLAVRNVIMRNNLVKFCISCYILIPVHRPHRFFFSFCEKTKCVHIFCTETIIRSGLQLHRTQQ